MKSQQALKVFGTLIFLLGYFGYLFPEWRQTVFTNNENLFHVLTGLLAIMLASFSLITRKRSIVLLGLIYFALGIYGFTLKDPTQHIFKPWLVKLDEIDNYLHVLAGLAFAWAHLSNREAIHRKPVSFKTRISRIGDFFRNLGHRFAQFVFLAPAANPRNKNVPHQRRCGKKPNPRPKCQRRQNGATLLTAEHPEAIMA
jgi:hypothetical protein